jgi:hypothetical protein
MEASGCLHALATFLPRKEPQYPLERRYVDYRARLDVMAKK